jgi:hypothetical protein
MTTKEFFAWRLKMQNKTSIQGGTPWRYAILFVALFVFLAGTALLMTATSINAQQDKSARLSQFGFTSSVPEGVWKAANEGLRPFLNAIPPLNREIYGFPAGGDLEQITLEQPYRVMTIHPKTLYAFNRSDDIRTMLTATQMWLFPVVQRGRTRAILTIDQMNGEWRAVSIGCAKIADELRRIEQAWPNDLGFNRCLVRIFQATSDVMLVVKDDVVDIMPFESARTSLRLEELGKGVAELYTVPEIIHRLIPVVQENINLHSQ